MPQSRLLLILEFCAGGELLERLSNLRASQQGLTEKGAAKIIYDIVIILNKLHAENIAHRDLKLENLLYTSKSYALASLKLCDFGFAAEDNGDLDAATFTPFYVAPEILQCFRDIRYAQSTGKMSEFDKITRYTKACDLWSLGVIVYIVLCGFPPFYPLNDENRNSEDQQSEENRKMGSDAKSDNEKSDGENTSDGGKSGSGQSDIADKPCKYGDKDDNPNNRRTSISGMDRTMRSKICNAEYEFDGPEWSRVSPAAKDVVKKLLQVDADKRITAEELLKHDWLSDIETIQETVLACGTRRNSDPETKRAAAVAVGLLYNEVEVIGGIA